VTQEKDPKTGRDVAGGKTSKTLIGSPPRPISRPPLSPSLTRDRDRSRPPAQKAAPKSAGAKEPLPEEISGSLVLSDDSSGSLPGMDELSNSLLLDDPTVVQKKPVLPLPAPVPPKPSAPGARRVPLGLPHLPPATPGPDLDSLPSLTPTNRPGPDAGAGAAEGPALSAPAGSGAAPGARAAAEPDPFASSQQAPAVVAQGTEPMTDDVEIVELPRGLVGDISDAVRRLVARARAAFAAASARGLVGDVGDAVKRLVARARAAFAAASEGPESRRTALLTVIALAGLGVGVGLVALVVSMTRRAPGPAESRTEATVAEPVASASAAAPPQASAVVEIPPPPLAAEVSTRPCTVAGSPHVVAPNAIIQAGVEVRTIGNDVAVGFAPDEHRATALRLDAGSLSALATVEADSTDPIRRVLPLGSSKVPLRLAVDVDREGDALQGRRTIPLEPPLQIGAAGGNVVWARPGGAVGGTLWPIDGEGDVEAARGAAELGDDAPSTAVALRHANAIWIGAATGHDALAPRGDLSRVGGSGSTVGSPAIAINDGVVVAAWADRASPSDPWRLKWVHFKAGEAPGDPKTFVPPSGGKGAQAMSPAVTAVPGGRFLLVWTEGPVTRHDVRALTLSRDGEALGKPLDVSSKGTNAGQGQAAVNASRDGLVAFLQSTEGGFQVVATPISCGL
jgi:hypothetical protein